MGNASGKVNMTIVGREILNSGIRTGAIPANILIDMDLRNGTSNGQIDLVYAVTETAKAASSTTVYDLAGTLTDSLGNTLTFVEVVLIAIRNRRNTALAWLSIGPDATNGFGGLSGNKGFWAADVAADADNLSIVGPAVGTDEKKDMAWLVVHDPTGVPVTGGSADELAVICSAVAGDVNSWDLIIMGRSA